MLLRALSAALCLVTPIAASAQDTSLRSLLIRYRCPVVDRLEQIYDAGDLTNKRHPFLVIALPDTRASYVQCLFHDANTRIFCEADSAFYETKPGEARHHLPQESIAALGRLGFSTDDSKGNFSDDLIVANPPDLNAIADFMLAALHDGYGARADMELSFNAPLAPHATTLCVAVS